MKTWHAGRDYSTEKRSGTMLPAAGVRHFSLEGAGKRGRVQHLPSVSEECLVEVHVDLGQSRKYLSKSLSGRRPNRWTRVGMTVYARGL